MLTKEVCPLYDSFRPQTSNSDIGWEFYSSSDLIPPSPLLSPGVVISEGNLLDYQQKANQKYISVTSIALECFFRRPGGDEEVPPLRPR